MSCGEKTNDCTIMQPQDTFLCTMVVKVDNNRFLIRAANWRKLVVRHLQLQPQSDSKDEGGVNFLNYFNLLFSAKDYFTRHKLE